MDNCLILLHKIYENKRPQKKSTITQSRVLVMLNSFRMYVNELKVDY